MAPIPEETIQEAKRMDLLTYLKHYEPYELVRISSNTYTTKAHDSLKISNGFWHWFSQGLGGKSALDYLIKVKGLSFPDAVAAITGRAVTPIDCKPQPKPSTPREFILPKQNSDNKKVISYLKSRGISEEILSHCIRQGILYESHPHHNAVFVGLDEGGIARYGACRSTGGRRFLTDCTGSDKRFSFRLAAEDSKALHLFESAIDLLSYATLLGLKGSRWQTVSLLSLGGIHLSSNESTIRKLPLALQGYLSRNPNICLIHLHLDNDRAGKAATASIQNALSKRFETTNEPPTEGKDVNDWLCTTLGLTTSKSISTRNMER